MQELLTAADFSLRRNNRNMSIAVKRDEFAEWLLEWMVQLRETGHVLTSIPADDATLTSENAEISGLHDDSHDHPSKEKGKSQAA